MLYLRNVMVLMLLTLALPGFANAAQMVCAKKINSFDFVLDYSGSMMMNHKVNGSPKVDIAKAVLQRINALIPALDYQGGLHTVAPSSTLLDQGPWDRAVMAQAITELRSDHTVFGRMTPMGDDMAGSEAWISSMARNAAIILLTDGGNNRGMDIVEVIRNIYATQRGLVVHVVSFAETIEEKNIVQQIAALNPETIVAEGIDLACDDKTVEQFVLDVFCTEQEEVVVLRGVNFAFDSARLDAKARNTLIAAAGLIKGNNKRVVLEGWTDSIGTNAYNARLSQRRAQAVRAFLAQQGISASRLSAIGRGKSFKYDNKTAQGRYLNRRVELLFQ